MGRYPCSSLSSHYAEVRTGIVPAPIFLSPFLKLFYSFFAIHLTGHCKSHPLSSTFKAVVAVKEENTKRCTWPPPLSTKIAQRGWRLWIWVSVFNSYFNASKQYLKLTCFLPYCHTAIFSDGGIISLLAVTLAASVLPTVIYSPLPGLSYFRCWERTKMTGNPFSYCRQPILSGQHF